MPIAAARMPAITSPARPAGRWFTTNAGKSWSLAMSAGASPAAQIAEPTSRNRVNCDHHHHPRADQRHPSVLERAGGQQALHDQVVGAVRRGREQRAADDSAQQGVGRGQAGLEVDDPKLARRRGAGQRLIRAARQVPGDEQRPHAARQIHRELKHVGPHHGLEAAEPGVDHRHHAHDDDRRRHPPAGDERQRDRAGEHPDRVAQEAGDEEDERREPPRPDAEARLEAGVGRLLLTPEISRQEPARDRDPADQVAHGELEEGQVAAGADAGDRDDRERRRSRWRRWRAGWPRREDRGRRGSSRRRSADGATPRGRRRG